MTSVPRANGFTLVELMVSLGIFGLIAAASALLLATSVDSQARVAARLDRTAELRRAAALLTADMAQAIDRRSRDGMGGERPAFAGGGGDTLVTLVRTGWDNPDAGPRSSLQRVEYRRAGTALVRVVHDHVDGAGGETAVPLVGDIVAVAVRFRSVRGWQDRWDAAEGDPLPRAVELVLTFTDGRRVVQRALVAS